MSKNMRISDDVIISIIEQEGTSVFTVMVQDGYRENRTVNLVDEEITKLRNFLNEVKELEEND